MCYHIWKNSFYVEPMTVEATEHMTLVAAKFESMARFEFSCHVILNLCRFDITWSINPLISNLYYDHLNSNLQEKQHYIYLNIHGCTNHVYSILHDYCNHVYLILHDYSAM